MRSQRGSGKQYPRVKRPIVYGHRGAAIHAPENTLLSFRRAVADGATVLETDVAISADGHLVLIHDPLVDRTTNGHGRVKSMTLSQLKRLDAGYRFRLYDDSGRHSHPYRGKGITIPTLEELLDEFPTMPLSLEVKPNDDRLLRELVRILRQRGRLTDGTVTLNAGSHAVMTKMRRLAPEADTAMSKRENFLFVVLTNLHLQWLFRSTGKAFHVPIKRAGLRMVSPRMIKSAHGLGYEVCVYTIDAPETMRVLLDMGVDGIFTNAPDRLSKLIKEDL